MATKLHLHFPYSTRPPHQISSEQEIIVGRAATCDVDLTTYWQDGLQAVSRQHFKLLYRKQEGFIIVDISYNGTLVNDDYLQAGKPRILRDGDLIKVANDENLVIKVAIDDDPDVTTAIADPALLFSKPIRKQPASRLQPPGNTTPSPLYFDEILAQFVVDGNPIPHEHLTKLEVNLLTYLCHNAGKLCSFDNIAAQVWQDPGWMPGNNTISRAVGNLRKKLDQISPGAEDYVQNIRGQGYKVALEA